MAIISLQGSETIRSGKDLEGFDKILPGRYHVLVKSVDDSFTAKGADKSVIFEFTILNGTERSEIGKTQKEYLTVVFKDADSANKGIKHPAKLALVTGLIRPEQLGQPLSVDFSAAQGRQLLIDIAKHAYKNAANVNVETTRVPFGGFHSIFVMDDKLAIRVLNGKYLLVSDVPLSMPHIATLGIPADKLALAPKAGGGQAAVNGGQATAGGNGGGQPTQTSQPVQVAPSAPISAPIQQPAQPMAGQWSFPGVGN